MVNAAEAERFRTKSWRRLYLTCMSQKTIKPIGRALMLTTFIETIPMPVMVIDAQQQVAAANKPLLALLGDHVLGRNFVAALRQPIIVTAVESVFQTGQSQTVRYLSRDGGRDTVFDVSVHPHADQVVLSFEDRTAVQAISQLRRDFVANVSHELRTPLTALFGFIETLRGPARNDPEARGRFLAIMEREASRMIRLVDDLLSLSRVEEDERIRPSQDVALGALLQTTIAELGPVISKANATIDIHDSTDDAVIPADARLMRQVIGNLVENAIKYGAQGGTVRIDLTGPDHAPLLRSEAISLTVTDQGPGIAAHHIPRLTERFYRVDSHRSREVGGTGLGLAIVKHIINRHRGRLLIDSTPGKGTAMTVILPTRGASPRDL